MSNSNPDVTEVIAYNVASCKHEKMTLTTSWRGGMPGRIGGQRPVNVWWCPTCKKDVRDWNITDDPKFKRWAERMDRGHAYLESIGKQPLDTLTSLERARWLNATSDDRQLKLFD